MQLPPIPPKQCTRASSLFPSQYFAIMALAFAVAQYGIARPLSRLAETMRTLLEATSVPWLRVRTGRTRWVMARSVEVFKENGLEAARLRQEQEASRAKAEEERRRNGSLRRRTRQGTRSGYRSARAGLAALAGKDLTYRIEEPLAEAYRKLKDNFNAAMDQIEGVIRSVSASTTTMATGTQEISSASDDLSRRTESQAASLERLPPLSRRLPTRSGRQPGSGSCPYHRGVCQRRGCKEQRCGQARDRFHDRIERTSQQITKIIGVIDEIAFQTNLLAAQCRCRSGAGR